MRIKSNKIVFWGVVSLFLLMLSSCGNKMQEAEALYTAGVRAAKTPDSLNEAAEMLLHSLSLQNEDEPTELLAMTYEKISRIYWNQDYPTKSLLYAKMSLKAMENIDNDSLLVNVYNRVASSYYLSDLTDKNDSAIVYFDKMLELAIATKDTRNIINAYNNLGAVFIMQGKIDEALKMFNRSHEVPDQLQQDKALYYYNCSRCY